MIAVHLPTRSKPPRTQRRLPTLNPVVGSGFWATRSTSRLDNERVLGTPVDLARCSKAEIYMSKSYVFDKLTQRKPGGYEVIYARQIPAKSLSRRSSAIIGIGAADGGMLFATLAQLAVAPAAHADIIVTGLDDTFAAANTALTDAATALGSGDVPDGLAYGFAGLDDYSLASLGTVLENGYLELTGYTELAAPTTLAATGTDVTSALSTAASDFTTAGNDFGSSDVLDGALSAFAGVGYLVEAPEIELIGLVDTTLGSL